jgi:hypothetical protein
LQADALPTRYKRIRTHNAAMQYEDTYIDAQSYQAVATK